MNSSHSGDAEEKTLPRSNPTGPILTPSRSPSPWPLQLWCGEQQTGPWYHTPSGNVHLSSRC